ncbi:MAG: FHA domain-containing protein [Polyangiaceae bacterium]
MSAKQLKYLRQYADELGELGVAAFCVKHRAAVLLGTGMRGRVSDRPPSWSRRTLGAEEMADLERFRSVLDRVWPIRKAAGTKWGSITLGQSMEADVLVTEYTVSTKHCAFGFEGYSMTVTDLGSLNGTHVNGVRLTPQESVVLRDGDELRFGRVMCRYMSAASFVAMTEVLAAAAAVAAADAAAA